MKRALFTLAIVSGLLTGCGREDAGAPVPKREAATVEQLNEMPPEARRAAENAARAGDFESRRMQEMADAQRKAQGGR
ncbi:MAG: hypothetical protein KIS66_09055 [Fimbriimonadaceae bacterium]|nr:hypothetical protein [Fimbriimonadaceae bacterium]